MSVSLKKPPHPLHFKCYKFIVYDLPFEITVFLAGIESLVHWVPVEPAAAVCAWKGWAVKQADDLHLICIQSRG